MVWLWLALSVLPAAALAFAAILFWYYLKIKRHYLPFIVRIFEERPLFIIPRGEPQADAEDVRLTTSEGLRCKLATSTLRQQKDAE